MKIIDQILSWLLVLAGTCNLLSRWVPALHYFWPVLLAGSGFAVLMLGIINVARHRSGDLFIHWAAVICNILGVIYAFRVIWASGAITLRAPIPLALAAVILVQAIFSFRR